MIRACVMLVAMLAPCFGHARGIDQAPSEHDRGQIETFYRPTFIVDGLPVVRPEDRVWTGDRWLPVYSTDGIRFIQQIEQEIRDGTIDAE